MAEFLPLRGYWQSLPPAGFPWLSDIMLSVASDRLNPVMVRPPIFAGTPVNT
jgi:hypothetical protein